MSTYLYTLADGTTTTVISSADDISFDMAMQNLCKAIDKKIENSSVDSLPSDNVYIPTAAFDSIMANFTG